MVTDYDNFKLNSVQKGYNYDQDKTILPKETYSIGYNKLLNAFPDEKFELNKISSTEGLYVYTFSNGVLTSTGKGATECQAKASAIMEFIERLSASRLDYSSVSGYEWISYDELSKREDIESIAVNLKISYSKKKEDLFNVLKKIPMLWIHGYSLTKERISYYPLNWTNTYQSSNGLASGNTNEEAILQAVCEVVERHNMDSFIMGFDDIELELIDQESIDNEVVQKLLETLSKNNVKMYLFNATLEVGVSTIIACGIDGRLNYYDFGYIGYGYGCQASPIKSIIRAITEYIQLSEQTIYNESGYFKDIQPIHNWQFTLNIDVEKRLDSAKIISYNDLPDLSNDDFKVELENVIQVLKKDGYDVIYVDKTHPKLDIPVCRIFIPGFLPGTKFASCNENDDLIVTKMLCQAGLNDEAEKYYEENFKSIIFENSNVFLELYYDKCPNLTRELLEEYATPETIPLKDIVLKDYQEQLKYNAKYFGPKK